MHNRPAANHALNNLLAVYAIRDELFKNIHAIRERVSIARQEAREFARDPLERRARLSERIKECTEGGKVAFVVEGMDCDCVKSLHVSLCDPLPFAIERRINLAFDGAEGPTSCWVVKPSEAPETYRRDLALEAFENGHPHVVRDTPNWIPGAHMEEPDDELEFQADELDPSHQKGLGLN